jgi:hypothetical protein
MSDKSGIRFVHALTAAAVVFMAASCATAVKGPVTPALRASIPGRLGSGEIRLGCHITCASAWQSDHAALHTMYDNKLWADLAAEVVRIGYRQDLSYFYLGRAAEGLHKPEGAITYYRLALTSEHCDTLINTCDGVDVQKESAQALSRLERH